MHMVENNAQKVHISTFSIHTTHRGTVVLQRHTSKTTALEKLTHKQGSVLKVLHALKVIGDSLLKSTSMF